MPPVKPSPSQVVIIESHLLLAHSYVWCHVLAQIKNLALVISATYHSRQLCQRFSTREFNSLTTLANSTLKCANIFGLVLHKCVLREAESSSWRKSSARKVIWLNVSACDEWRVTQMDLCWEVYNYSPHFPILSPLWFFSPGGSRKRIQTGDSRSRAIFMEWA